jgi:hypothetical protein
MHILEKNYTVDILGLILISKNCQSLIIKQGVAAVQSILILLLN